MFWIAWRCNGFCDWKHYIEDCRRPDDVVVFTDWTVVRSTKTVLLAILFRALFNANIQAFRQAIFPWCHVKRPQGGVLADLLNVPRDGSLWAPIPSPPWFAATPGRSSQRSNCCLRAPLMGPLWYGARRRYSLRLQYIFSFFKNTSPQDWPYRAKAVKWVVVCYSGRAQCAGSLYAAECTLPLSLTYTYLVAFARHGHICIFAKNASLVLVVDW